jgi:hypothetical protein
VIESEILWKIVKENRGWGEIHIPIHEQEKPHPETKPKTLAIFVPRLSPSLLWSLRCSTDTKWRGTEATIPNTLTKNQTSTHIKPQTD